MSKVIKKQFKNNLRETVLETVNELGGFKKFISPGDIVLLKPNFNTADPFPASTDFEFLKIMVELVYEAGAKEVIVGDSCTIYQKTKNVLKDKGIYELEKLAKPARVINFDEDKWIKKKIPNGKFLESVRVPAILDKVDKLIYLPCLKTHYIAKFTASLKLSVGFMKTIERVGLHARHVEEKIAELNKVINPDLIIMDARKIFITKGPTDGEVREPNLILASTNRVAIDIEGVKIIKSFKGNTLAEVEPEDLEQIKVAKEIGIDKGK
ncbi:MAG: DUF362 domain-containing protein [Patescibacteria group bacterium]